MKIAALVAVVSAGRQARDAQLNESSDVEQRNANFGESTGLARLLMFYLDQLPGDGDANGEYVGRMLSYGCWCQIRNTAAGGIVPGHGDPVDALDEACKAWHQCRACTAMDFSTDDETCNTDYSIPYRYGEPVQCQNNSDECTVSIFINDLYRRKDVMMTSSLC